MSPRPSRLHHLDALRALAMILILPVHAISLIQQQSGGGNDIEASIFWTLHAFRMPLFFLIAGFFAALMLNSRGLTEMLRNRAVHIGVPLVVGCVFVVPPLAICTHAVSGTPGGPGSSGLLGTLTNPEPSYLWFLWYLIVLYGVTLVLRHVLATRRGFTTSLTSLAAHLLSHPVGPLLLAFPTACLLYWQPTWDVGPTAAESFVPVPELLAFYGLFFLAGWALFATPGLRVTIEARPARYAVLAALTLPPALTLYLLQSDPAIGQGRFFHILALLLLSATTWSLVLGLLGLSRRHLSKHSPRMRYWADASYWIYLSHLLPMAALAVALLDVAMPWTVRLTILSAATLVLIYFSYGAFVRYSVIGRVLHGPRQRPQGRPRHISQLPAAAAARRA